MFHNSVASRAFLLSVYQSVSFVPFICAQTLIQSHCKMIDKMVKRTREKHLLYVLSLFYSHRPSILAMNDLRNLESNINIPINRTFTFGLIYYFALCQCKNKLFHEKLNISKLYIFSISNYNIVNTFLKNKVQITFFINFIRLIKSIKKDRDRIR